MTLFDYVVITILVVSVILSFVRGLIKEVLSLLGWVIAFLVACAYGEDLAHFLPFADHSVRLIVAYVALFIIVLLLMWLIALALDSVITAIGLKPVDRSLGSIFGLVRGFVIVLALMLLAGLTDIPRQPFWTHSLLRPVLESVALAIKPHLPGSLAQFVHF